MRGRTTFACLLGLCLYTAGMTAAAQPYATSPRTCPLPLLGEVEGESYSCGVLAVPENYTKPEGRTLEISYAVLKSTSLSPAPDPVIYLDGGPGASSLANLDGYADMFASLRATRDLIFFDQRGTEYSSNLTCSPALLAINRYAKSDPELAALLKKVNKLEAEAELTPSQEATVYGICAELLRETHNLSQYNSRTSAKDVSNLVRALGYGFYNLYGISYGTRLALNVLRTAPKDVRSVVLDSSYPPQLNSYENDPALYDEAFVDLFRLCAEDSGCNASYPNLPEKFETLLERLDKRPLELNPPAPAAGIVAAFAGVEDGTETDNFDLDDVGMLAEILNQQGNAVAGLYPQIISQLVAGKTGAYRAFLSGKSIDEDQQVDPDTLPPVERLTLQAQALQQSIAELEGNEVAAAVTARPAVKWVTALLEVISGFDGPQEQDAKLDFLGVLYSPHTRATLSSYLNTALITDLGAVSDAKKLQQQLQKLSDNDVRGAFEFLGQLADALTEDTGDIDAGIFNAVDCSEETPFNRAAKIESVVTKMRFPLLATVRGKDALATMKVTCALWDEVQAPKSIKEPVVSNVPTLIFSGLFDTQTPPSWNARAEEGLGRSTLLTFPGAGHGVIMFSQCAKDVAAAFVTNPSQTLDRECIATLKPHFVLPKGKQAVK